MNSAPQISEAKTTTVDQQSRRAKNIWTKFENQNIRQKTKKFLITPNNNVLGSGATEELPY